MIRTSSILLLTLLTLMSCKVVDENSNNNTQTLKTFQITNGEIQGWSFESGWEWQSFNAINMDTKVDGDCEYFIKGGLATGAAQKIQNDKSDPMEKSQIWIMDFSTSERIIPRFNDGELFFENGDNNISSLPGLRLYNVVLSFL